MLLTVLFLSFIYFQNEIMGQLRRIKDLVGSFVSSDFKVLSQLRLVVSLEPSDFKVIGELWRIKGSFVSSFFKVISQLWRIKDLVGSFVSSGFKVKSSMR